MLPQTPLRVSEGRGVSTSTLHSPANWDAQKIFSLHPLQKNKKNACNMCNLYICPFNNFVGNTIRSRGATQHFHMFPLRLLLLLFAIKFDIAFASKSVQSKLLLLLVIIIIIAVVVVATNSCQR